MSRPWDDCITLDLVEFGSEAWDNRSVCQAAHQWSLLALPSACTTKNGGSVFQCTVLYPYSCAFRLNLHKGCIQVDNGFLEAIVRGYKAGILSQNQYANLTQCETLEGT